MKSGIMGSIVAAIITACILIPGIASHVVAQESAEPKLAAKGAWSAAATYAKDDIVTARGSAWISLRAGNMNRVPGQTAGPSSALWWRLFARGFNPTGAWSSATTYQPDDLVTHGGQTYRAKVTNFNKQPTNTNNWELLASKGATGPAGPNTGVSSGSQSVPAISFNSDADTGIFSPEAGKIALVENGALFLHNKGTRTTALGLDALANNTSTGLDNTAVGDSALKVNTVGDFNTAFGSHALTNSTVSANTGIGYRALEITGTGGFNTGVGYRPLFQNLTGANNTAVGADALALNETGNNNVAIGNETLVINAGTSNIALGFQAGSSAETSNSSIFIGNAGDSADDQTIKIGTQGTQTSTFIAGIAGVNAGDVPVYVDSSTGQLGIGPAPSSRRFKYDIETMSEMSTLLGKLRPVTFRYNQPRSDGSHPMQYGLIAEEVAELIPDLALFDKDGRPNGVKYHLLPSFLLAGWQAQQKTIALQTAEITALKQRLAAIEALLPRIKEAAVRH